MGVWGRKVVKEVSAAVMTTGSNDKSAGVGRLSNWPSAGLDNSTGCGGNSQGSKGET